MSPALHTVRRAVESATRSDEQIKAIDLAESLGEQIPGIAPARYVHRPQWARVLAELGAIEIQRSGELPYTWLLSNVYMMVDVWHVLVNREAVPVDFNMFASNFVDKDGEPFPPERAQRIRKRASETDRARQFLPVRIENALKQL